MKLWLLNVTVAFFVSVPLCFADPIEILAIGDSQTNGKGIPQSSAYPAQLETILRSDGYDVVVINAGIDGQKFYEIYNRMTSREVNERTKIVILQGGGNDTNTSSAIEYEEKSLAWLQDHHLPAVLISSKRVKHLKMLACWQKI